MIRKSRTKIFRMIIKKAVFIVGPTGVGKTGLAVRVAETLGTEIISADSRQVYRELSIGTAVPDSRQRRRVKHHLLQHRSVREPYNASMFEEEAIRTMNALFEKFPAVVVCGGSGLYIQAICTGIDDIPPVDPEIRRTLLERMDREGIESLRFELKKLDPASYENIDLKNPQRILKALEISLGSGRPYSGYLSHVKKDRGFFPVKIGLNLDRDMLYERINRRVDRMMEEGLLEEVQNCLEYRGLNALNTVGYVELFEYLDGKHSLEEAIRLIKRNTRRYARRQMTWFRGDPEIIWFRPEQEKDIIDFIRSNAVPNA